MTRAGRPRAGVNDSAAASRAAARPEADSQVRGELERCLRRDQRRLRQLARGDMVRYREALAEAQARLEARLALPLKLDIAESLPIASQAAALAAELKPGACLVVAGETGSGKTTQLPKLALQAGFGQRGRIALTQPRRLAARTIAARLAAELAQPQAVGYKTRFEDQVPENARVKVVTDGILLAEIERDRLLDEYDCVIVDEAHERSLNVDFLLGYLAQLRARRPDLLLVVTSATIDIDQFGRFLAPATAFEIPGRGYPVEIRYCPPDVEARNPPTLEAQIGSALDQLWAADPHGDVLVFLPGEREILAVSRALKGRRDARTEVLPLYARLSIREQQRIFEPGPARRVVLTTNVAETSLTVPRIRYVIDSGLARVKRFAPRLGVERLQIEPISQAAAAQRSGRCGRLAAGIAIRLWSAADHERRPAFSDPEIRRSALAQVLLRMKVLGLPEPEQFAWLDAPTPKAIAQARAELREIGAIADDGRLTALGRRLARWNIDLRLARTLESASELAVLAPALVVCAALATSDPRERPLEERVQADAAHRSFELSGSDLHTWLSLWDALETQHQALSRRAFDLWCQQMYLAPHRVREWRELHRQLRLIAGTQVQTPPADPLPALHQAFIAGHLSHLGRRAQGRDYEGARGRRFVLHRSTALSRHKALPEYIVAAQFLDTDRVQAVNAFAVEARWLEQVGQAALKRRLFDPHWSARRGEAQAFEQLSLYGVVIVERRRVALAPHDPGAARGLLLRAGLAGGELPFSHPVLSANRALILDLREREKRQRRADLTRSDDELAQWFEQRLPADIATGAQLRAWLAVNDARVLALTETAVLSDHAQLAAADAYPSALPLGGNALTIEWRHAPGESDDGATVVVPLTRLPAMTQALLDAAIPGFVQAHAEALIRSLPKAVRKHFVPVPDYARAALAGIELGREPLATGLARELTRIAGMAIEAAMLVAAPTVQTHARVRLVDGEGRVLDEAFDLALIRSRWLAQAQAALGVLVAQALPGTRVDGIALPDLPALIALADGTRATPVLAVRGAEVVIDVAVDASLAADSHRTGVRALLLRAVNVARMRRQLALPAEAAFAYASLAPVDGLYDELLALSIADATTSVQLDAVRGRAALEALLVETRSDIQRRAAHSLAVLEPALALIRPIRRLLDDRRLGYGSASFDDAAAQLQRLLGPGFVGRAGSRWLAELPRFMRALRLRLERLQRDATADQARLIELRELEKLGAGLAPEARLEYGWLLEELRVSFYAQELGTRHPVSAKRLKLWAQRGGRNTD